MENKMNLESIEREKDWIIYDSYLSNLEKVKRLNFLQDMALRYTYLGNEEEQRKAIAISEDIRVNLGIIIIEKSTAKEKEEEYNFMKNYVCRI